MKVPVIRRTDLSAPGSITVIKLALLDGVGCGNCPACPRIEEGVVVRLRPADKVLLVQGCRFVNWQDRMGCIKVGLNGFYKRARSMRPLIPLLLSYVGSAIYIAASRRTITWR